MACAKIPNDWEDQEKIMMYKVGYLVKAYNIPPILVMNKIKWVWSSLYHVSSMTILLRFLAMYAITKFSSCLMINSN
jgi:hypothetical protein